MSESLVLKQDMLIGQSCVREDFKNASYSYSLKNV